MTSKGGGNNPETLKPTYALLLRSREMSVFVFFSSDHIVSQYFVTRSGDTEGESPMSAEENKSLAHREVTMNLVSRLLHRRSAATRVALAASILLILAPSRTSLRSELSGVYIL